MVGECTLRRRIVRHPSLEEVSNSISSMCSMQHVVLQYPLHRLTISSCQSLLPTGRTRTTRGRLWWYPPLAENVRVASPAQEIELYLRSPSLVCIWSTNTS
ncbi:unnamed protein product, partial [Sphacelaria rigidula]